MNVLYLLDLFVLSLRFFLFFFEFYYYCVIYSMCYMNSQSSRKVFKLTVGIAGSITAINLGFPEMGYVSPVKGFIDDYRLKSLEFINEPIPKKLAEQPSLELDVMKPRSGDNGLLAASKTYINKAQVHTLQTEEKIRLLYEKQQTTNK